MANLPQPQLSKVALNEN
jgi:hypothetical protein